MGKEIKWFEEKGQENGKREGKRGCWGRKKGKGKGKGAAGEGKRERRRENGQVKIKIVGKEIKWGVGKRIKLGGRIYTPDL